VALDAGGEAPVYIAPGARTGTLGLVAVQPVRTWREIAQMVEDAPPPTDDDVPITRDGRRLDSPEKVRAWLDDLNQSLRAELEACRP
jgi:hypothetical protein